MKVLCVGFPKTGTKSLCAALRELGYEVYDYEENMYYLRKEWVKILTEGGTKDDFRKMYENVDATMDVPACYFWEEMLEAFPDVKLIFTQREDELQWLQSLNTHVRTLNSSMALQILSIVSLTGHRSWMFGIHMGRTIFGSDTIMPGKMLTGISRTVALKRYRDHNTCVMAKAPKTQLLHFNLKEGWEPLCKFLGKPVPQKAFPHKNKQASIIKEAYESNPIIAIMKKEMYYLFAFIVLALGCIFYLIQN